MITAEFASPSIAIGVAALMAGALYLSPEMSRRGIFFSVTVPADFPRTDAAKRILRSYRTAIVANGLVAVALAALVPIQPLSIIAAVVWLCGFYFAALARARRQTLAFAVPIPTVREASIAPRPAAFEDRWLIQAMPLLPLAAAALLIAAHWSQIPAHFPLRWGFNGRPNRWAAKTPLRVFAPLLIGAVMCALVAAISHFIRKSARRPVGRGPAAELEDRFRAKIAQFILAAEMLIAVTFSLVGLAPIIRRTATAGLLKCWPFVNLAAIALLLIWAVQATRDRRRNLASAPTDLTADNCWRGGIFYLNPNDPALFVEKRMGFGYTLNFGHPGAWAILLGLLVPLVVVVLLITRR